MRNWQSCSDVKYAGLLCNPQQQPRGDTRRGEGVLTRGRCCLLPGERRAECGDLNGFLRSGRWRQMGPRVSQASPSQALETIVASLSCSMWTDCQHLSPWQILSRTEPSFRGERRPGVCLWQLWRVLWCKQSSAAPCLQVDRWWCGDDGHYECQSSVMRNEDRSLDTVILLKCNVRNVPCHQ